MDLARSLLLVVDEHEDSRIIVRTIAQYDGFDVLEAAHARSGLQLARERRPDVIVIAFDLRIVSAAVVLGELRADPRLAHVPVIALVAAADERQARADGFTAAVCKPIAVTELLAELRRVASPLDA